MRASEGVTGLRLPPVEALRAEPALVIAHDLPAVAAVFQVGRHLVALAFTAVIAVRTSREHGLHS
jgi:hypothetical protein